MHYGVMKRVFLNFLSLMIIFSPFLAAVEAGHVWEEDELGALKYDHTYPFVVLKENVILYSSKEDGGDHYDIWRMDLDGSDHRQLTDNDIDEIRPTSDDNARKIVFTGGENIFIMDFDGSDQNNIIDSVDEGFALKDASISSDGDWVVFSSNMDNETDKNWGAWDYFTSIPMDIWKCEMDGDNAEQLTDRNWDEYSPAFSPDRERIVFVAEESTGDEDIHLMDDDGGNWVRLVTWQSKDDTGPSFSPDGRFIIYSDGNNDDKYAAMHDLETGESGYITAETTDEAGDELVENIKGRYFRFYPPADNIDELKVIYSSTSGAFYPKLSIWTSEKVKAWYTVTIGPIERESGSYSSEPIEGASVGFTLEEIYYENMSDENGWASFILPVGKLPGVWINASMGDEWIEWNSYYAPQEFSSDLVEIGPIRLHTEKTDSWGDPLPGALVSFTYKGGTYENITDEEGYAQFRLVMDGKRADRLPTGTMISATWNGETQTWEDGEDEAEFHRHMIGIGPIVMKTDSSNYYGDEVEGALVTFSYEGDDYENLTDEDGYAYFGPFRIEDLPDGTLINVTYKNEWISWEQGDYTIPNFASYEVVIGQVRRLRDGSDYSGAAVKGAVVSFEYKGKQYENFTDEEGNAHFTLDVKKLPKGIEIKAKKGGDRISWEQDDNIPKFQYEPTASDWIMDYLGVFIVGGIFFLAIIVGIIQKVTMKKKGGGRVQGHRQQRQAVSEQAYDAGKSSAAKGNDLFARKMYPQALGQYQTASRNLETALTWARRENDQGLMDAIEGMLSNIRDNAVSCEMAMDKKKVEEGYRDAQKTFESALRSIQDDKLFEGRRNLMEVSRKLEHLVTIAKSRNFVQAIKNITVFLVKVRENINVADIKMSQGIDTVSFGDAPDIGSAGVMAQDVAISGTTKHERGYVVESLKIKNNTMFDVNSAELKITTDGNVLRLSHTHPAHPVSETSVSFGTISKGAEKKLDIYFDPLVSSSTHLDISLIYVDSQGKYRASALGRKNIEIEPPEFVSDSNVNIATLRDMIITKARFQDSRVYAIDPKVPLKEVLTLAKEGIAEANLSKVRDARSKDINSSWFYATARGGRESIIIRASVMENSRVLEIFAACTEKEHLATVLADITGKVCMKLREKWRQLQPVTQVNVEIKDSIIQRSNLDFGGIAGGTPGNVEIKDSVLTRSSVGSANEHGVSVYRNLLIIALQDGYINEDEERMLADSRKKLGISMEQHRQLLSALNR